VLKKQLVLTDVLTRCGMEISFLIIAPENRR